MNVGIDYLREGMVVDQPIYIGKALLVGAGVTLTETLIDSLKKHRYKFEKDSIKISFGTISKETQQEIETHINWDHNNIDNSINDFLREETSQALKVAEHNLANPLSPVEQCARKITDILYWQQLKTNEATNEKEWVPNLTYNLADYGDSFNIHDHSIRVSQFAVTLAAAYNKKKNDEGKHEETINLEEITMAALLHDYGVRFRDKNEMAKLANNELSEHLITHYNIDRDLLKKPYQEKYIPIYTFTALRLPVSSTINGMILYNYETENGTGPLKTTNETLKTSMPIKMASKIIHLCSLYDNTLTQAINNGLNGKDMNLENVSAVLDYAAVNGMVNKELKEIFTEIIPLYSIGTRVELSDGRFARVIERPKNQVFAARPVVQTTDNEIINLADAPLSLTIRSIVPKEKKLSSLVNNIAASQIAGKVNENYEEFTEKESETKIR